MHCFIGLHVQEPLASSILDLTHRWNGLNFPPADFHKHTYPHITIIPPFDIEDPSALINGLTKLTATFPGFDADYAQVNAFNRRILHIAIDSNGIVDLRAQLYEYGKGTFIYQDEHPVFHAHSTIAYMHDPLTEADFINLKANLENRLGLPTHQQVTSVQLYGRHHPGQDYQSLAQLRLQQE